MDQKKKKPSLQDETDAWVAMQMKMADKTKGSDRLGIGLFLAMIAIFGALILILPDKTFSEQENRVLQTAPKLQSNFEGSFTERVKAGKFLDRYFSGDFAEDVSDYYADQFPARDVFVGIKGAFEIAMLKGENNDVVLGKNQYLLTRMDKAATENIEKNFNAASAFAAYMETEGVPVTFATAGRVIDVMRGSLPALFSVDTLDKPWDALTALCETGGSSMEVLNLLVPLRAHADRGEDVMYRTDHHWTTYGAYLAYTEIMKAWGVEPAAKDAFTVETVSNAFYGTAWRNAGMKWIAPDTMEYYRYPGDEDYTTTIHDNNTSFAGFYDRSFLEVTDQYSSFISGNHAYVTVERNGDEPRERLMLIKDSFGHSLVPFLAYHYDLEIVDMRYYKKSVAELVQETGCSRVLILNNMDSLTSAASLGMLRMGIE